MPGEQIYTTTDAGAPVGSDEHSLTVGAGGPIVVHDHYLIEQMAQNYHFITDQGHESFTQDEADQMASIDTDYHTRDLFEHIDNGEFPSWTLKVQLVPFDDAVSYRFNPFDLTKVWPHGDYPLQEVGRMTLNRNPTDHHTEIEQLAFEPNNLVPGIGLSPDRMLLARGFSYADAHRYRIGANYKQIPVNASKYPVHSHSKGSHSKDGAMRVTKVSDPVYAPNSKGGPAAATGFQEPVLARAFEYWSRVDPDLGSAVEAGVRAKADELDPKAAEQSNPARAGVQQKA